MCGKNNVSYVKEGKADPVPAACDRGRIEVILDHFADCGRIAGYERLYDENEGVRRDECTWEYKRIRGVRIKM